MKNSSHCSLQYHCKKVLFPLMRVLHLQELGSKNSPLICWLSAASFHFLWAIWCIPLWYQLELEQSCPDTSCLFHNLFWICFADLHLTHRSFSFPRNEVAASDDASLTFVKALLFPSWLHYLSQSFEQFYQHRASTSVLPLEFYIIHPMPIIFTSPQIILKNILKYSLPVFPCLCIPSTWCVEIEF